MATQTIDLWELTHGKPQIDPTDLAEAVCQQAGDIDLDYRTRMLICESVEALRVHWGIGRVQRWLARCPHRERIETICQEEFDKIGFPTLRRRLMDKTKPEVIHQLLEELGLAISQETTIHIAGAVALILPGYLNRQTNDIDFINEVPAPIRNQHELLHRLEARYGLTLGHVQSHYFPSGWQQRVHSLGIFGRLRVFLVDVYDVLLSKLCSARDKDRDDIRLLAPQIDKDVLVRRFKGTCAGFLAAPRLLELAQQNWQIVFGEPLPHDPDTPTSQGTS